MIIYVINIMYILLFCALLYVLHKHITTYNLKDQLLISITHSYKNDTYLYEFLFFLIDNKCLVNYINELNQNSKKKKNTKFHKLTELVSCYKRKDILVMSFKWTDTKDGFEFWHNLHCKWQNYSSGNVHDIMVLINYVKNLNLK